MEFLCFFLYSINVSHCRPICALNIDVRCAEEKIVSPLCYREKSLDLCISHQLYHRSRLGRLAGLLLADGAPQHLMIFTFIVPSGVLFPTPTTRTVRHCGLLAETAAQHEQANSLHSAEQWNRFYT
jgi:hypothetical protein